MNEHGYIRSVHRYLPASTYHWKINDNYAGGVPDAFYCDQGQVLFVEYKYVPKLPKREKTILSPKLSGNQELWLTQRYSQNVPVAVVLGTPIGSVMFVNCSWEQGISLAKLKEISLSSKGIANIIHNHCIGNQHVDTHGETYPNC